MDLSGIKTGFLLNKGFPWSDQIKPFTDPNFDKPRVFKAHYWRTLQRGLLKSDIKQKKSFVDLDAELDAIQTKSRETGVIPIGIINVTGNQLSNKEINENKILKSQGKTSSDKTYRQVQILAAAALISSVYNKQVTFIFDPHYVYADQTQDLNDLEVDFGDDKGFQKIDWKPTKSSKVTITYSGVGEKIVTFRFNSQKAGTYVCHSVFEVAMEEIPTPSQTLDITAPKTKLDKSANGRVSIQLAGGQANIYLGCDGVFDKPVIIVEGFDGSNVMDFNYLLQSNKYGANGIFYNLHQAGYDRVILNFNDGGDYIQNNAQVLKELINRVNQLKSGTTPNIVIGESMGGLVARIALKEMERDGQQHHVSHYISFDTPHLGANVPLGLQFLGIDIDSMALVNLLNLSPSDLQQQVTNVSRPAARQMLRYHYNMPDAQPDLEYYNLQNQLQALDFPTQCRNIAILNGSRNGTGWGFNPGSMLLQFDNITLLASTFVRSRSHNIGGNTRISSLTTLLVALPTTVRTHDITTSNPNFDALAGGILPGGISSKMLISASQLFISAIFNIGYNNVSVQDNICFIPSLSAISYTGPLSNQSDWQVSVNNAISLGRTPFQAVYANDNNSSHVLTDFQYGNGNSWSQLFANEFNVNFNYSCPTVPPANWSGTQFVCAGSSYQYLAGLSYENSNIAYTWTVNPGNYTLSGNPVDIRWNLNPGVYYLTCSAKDQTSSGNPSNSSTGTIYVQNCSGGGNGCTQRFVSIVSPTNGNTFTTSTFPFYFDIQTNTCDPQGIMQIQYNIVDPNGNWFWIGYVDNASAGGSYPYTLKANQWTNFVSSNNAYQITHPGTYILQARLFSNSGVITDAPPVPINIVQTGSGGNPGSGGTYNQCFEAEASTVTGTGTISNDANASGGQYVGGFGNPSEYRQFNVNSIPSNGTYTLKIRYATGENPTIGIVLNGNSTNPQIVSAPTTQSWAGNYNEISTSVSLNQGNNTIRIQGNSQGFVLDRICVVGGTSNGRVASTEPSSEILLFPNPAASSVTVQRYLSSGQLAELAIIDASGRETYVRMIVGEGNLHQEVVDVHKWPSGTYVVKLQTDQESTVKKLVINH
ncbi:T9SS type A sorting domain-containing protein [Spirosoma sp. SC4-14]|uniref:T9SS type A sorting domain-containing protein n=1 Tax=Spirosoma sp. SC4-14 TaxID=3128900 RepID=UPI0030CAF6B7